MENILTYTQFRDMSRSIPDVCTVEDGEQHFCIWVPVVWGDGEAVNPLEDADDWREVHVSVNHRGEAVALALEAFGWREERRWEVELVA